MKTTESKAGVQKFPSSNNINNNNNPFTIFNIVFGKYSYLIIFSGLFSSTHMQMCTLSKLWLLKFNFSINKTRYAITSNNNINTNDYNFYNLFISGERPYICRHCGKAFSQNGTLKRHSQTCKAAYNKNNSNTNNNNNENRDVHFSQKFPTSTPTTHHQSSFIKNISNNITDPINLKPSNFSTLLCDPIDGLSDTEGKMNLSQSINNINHIKTTLPTTMNSINTNMNIVQNNKTNVNKLSNRYIYPEPTEKQLHVSYPNDDGCLILNKNCYSEKND